MSEKRSDGVAGGAAVALGEPDELIALLAAGIEVCPCRSAEELEEQLEALASRRRVRLEARPLSTVTPGNHNEPRSESPAKTRDRRSLVLVTEGAAELNQEALDESRRRHGLVILVVPTLRSHRRLSERGLSRLLEEAAGADLLARQAEQVSQTPTSP